MGSMVFSGSSLKLQLTDGRWVLFISTANPASHKRVILQARHRATISRLAVYLVGLMVASAPRRAKHSISAGSQLSTKVRVLVP